MSDPKLRLIIDGVDLTAECDSVEMATPAMVHVIPTDSGARCQVLGPKNFTLLISSPSDRLYALIDGGKQAHEVKLVADWAANSITHPTHFHKGWVDAAGVRKMFGSLAPDREREAKWVEEPLASASSETDRRE